jgi:glycosyltransferase involved in cell wall biosynthesis
MESQNVEVLSIDRIAESKIDFLRMIAGSFFSPRPVIVDRYTSTAYLDKVRELCDSGNFDLMHCDSISLAEAALHTNALPIPWGLTAHNVEAIIWERWSQEEPNLLKRWFVAQQYQKVFSYEKLLSQRADLICAVSDEDEARLKTMYQARYPSVVPNGVDIDYFAPSDVAEETDTLVFTGSMDWRPNQDGILWFVDEIWPRLIAKRPTLKFWIVGRKPPERLIRLGETDNRLIVTGTVDDVRSYIAKGAVYVVPLRIGGGSRLKILEALSMRKGIVSTTVGAEGLTTKHEQHLIKADQPEDFARRVIELLDNPTRRNQLGQAGEELVRAEYTWPQIAQKQVLLWNDTIARFRSHSADRGNA